MQFVEFQISSGVDGKILPFGRVTVWQTGTSTLASLFDSGGSATTNPVVADINGIIGFQVANGTYDFQISSQDGTYVSPKIIKQQIFDLSGVAGGTVTSISGVTANGVSFSIANPTTTPAITITLGAITPTSVAASGSVTGSNLSGTNTGDQTITLTGNVTGSGTGSFVTTIAPGAVTLARMAALAANSFIGNNTGSAATPIALTAAQATAMLIPASGTDGVTAGAQGVVPAPQPTDDGNFLRADMTWAPGGSGGGGGGISSTPYSITFNNGGSGAASGTAFDGSAAYIISYNTLGAAPLASPNFTGTPTVPTAAPGTNTTQAASTAFVTAAVSAGGTNGGWTTISLSSDFTTTSTTLTDVTGLSIANTAFAINSIYEIEGTIIGKMSAGSISFGLTVPTAGVTGSASMQMLNGSNSTTAQGDLTGGALAINTVNTTTFVETRIRCLLITAAATPTGNFKIQTKANSGANTATIGKGSFLKYRKIA